jgi:uncharacterized protein (UPF0276 family)
MQLPPVKRIRFFQTKSNRKLKRKVRKRPLHLIPALPVEWGKTGILSSVACNLDVDILTACLPLLEESRIDALEWSFDALYREKEIPGWFNDLLTAFSNEHRLIGHGIFFSLFSGKWLAGQEDWLRQLQRMCRDFQFDHITEHFGFMTGKDFHHGAPLGIPYTSTTLRIGRDRLKRIYDACRCPVGLENLAFSTSVEEVKRHGVFLEQLLEPVNGFIILDLHNIYCQLHNFGIAFEELIGLYPLHRVREIHISGGSWDKSQADPGRTVRRDTHDHAVPEEVFRLLESAIGRCPHLRYVVLEQLGVGLQTAAARKTFYDDFLKMQRIVRENDPMLVHEPERTFLPGSIFLPGEKAEDETLYQQQLELSRILETASTYEEVIHRLSNSSLARSDWEIENWEPYMVEVAMKIAQKWKVNSINS